MEENQVLENVAEEMAEVNSGTNLKDVATGVLLTGLTIIVVKGVKKVVPKLKDKFGKKKQEVTIDEDGIVEMIDDIEDEE
ncbi:hypothetical protein [Anaerostipes sp. PC18]|uniref:hypothetical protein n=1 Tax=Anaerostipes sp. PC18 TaxID=3036926 RepID=UPI00308489D0|nr:hypothetical protein P8F77_10365 [Anaerostipes sp. PC18]